MHETLGETIHVVPPILKIVKAYKNKANKS